MGWLRSGYSQAELEDAQARFDLRFPPDLVELLLDRRPAGGYDWRTDFDRIEQMLAWPLEGLLFDVEHNDFWLAEWGECPPTLSDRCERVRDHVAKAPKLIPLFSHRYLPAEPFEAGNPVFSIYQSDIIYYGANLEHYFSNEFGGWTSREPNAYRHIRFWSDLAG